MSRTTCPLAAMPLSLPMSGVQYHNLQSSLPQVQFDSRTLFTDDETVDEEGGRLG